jgi:5-methyltetrahydrofolate--homocysteine methyltransferase
MENLLEQIALCVERGKINAQSPYPPDLKGQEGADELTRKALDTGISAYDILNSGLMIGMQRIGVRFRDRKVFVPDVLIAAKAMSAAMVHIRPFFVSNEVQHKGKIVIGTVTGDLHDIGKNIVGMIFEGGGWNVIDIGVDASADKFIAAIKTNNAKAVGLSALLTTTMMNMEGIVKKIKETLPDVKIIVGGAPLTQGFSDKIGADGYFPEPQGALEYLNLGVK